MATQRQKESIKEPILFLQIEGLPEKIIKQMSIILKIKFKEMLEFYYETKDKIV